MLLLREQKAEPDDPDPDRWWVIQDRPGLSGTDIKDPEQSFDTTIGNEPIVTFNFTDKGRQAFQTITRHVAERGADNAFGGDPLQTSQHFAIALDNELVSAPYINWRQNSEGIDGSTGAQISGSFTIQSAQDLATILKIGALPLTLNEVSRSQVSATLGQQALDQGLIAGIAGFIIVALFLIIFYRVLGVIATLAMLIYALYFYAVVKLIPITLTLPGIAGLILTLGVAADANIVIFERVKEEVRAGRSVGTAIVTGYRKGLTAIIDANIVTFLVAFILFILATSGVQGFAFTLGLGVILSLLTAVLATQAILYSLRNTRLLSSSWALGAGEQKHKFQFDYMGKAKWFFSASGCILLVCALAMSANGINFGIDFDGGARITAPLDRAATVDQVRETISPLGLADAKIQTLDNETLGPNVVQISTEEGVDVDAVNAALADDFGNPNPNVEEIGPSFGESVANSALIAIIASLLVITVYLALRFEPKFTVPVLIAVMHDILIVAGVYALTRPGGDDGDGRGAPDGVGLLLVRHDHRDGPNQRERASNAERGVLPDRQPLAVGGHRPLAGDVLLHAAAGAGADVVRRRDAAGLRVRAVRRYRVRYVLVDLHRHPGAPALEGARAGLPRPPRADPRAPRPGARVRGRRPGRSDRRPAQGAQAPFGVRASRPGSLRERVPGHGQGPRHRRGDRASARGCRGGERSGVRPSGRRSPRSRAGQRWRDAAEWER